ncbi:hypothetical protein DL96DRAFT_1703308 [Flagelloscypha sp. PMI_526]|nr:hypothetical protein DL96DRAFT_1703308 [Flagelloscypha sp. PMI_526]
MATETVTHTQAGLAAAAVKDAMKHLSVNIDLNKVGEREARKLMSAEHKALGYRPPPGSLAAAAQSAAAKHPNPPEAEDIDLLKKAAVADASKVSQERGAWRFHQRDCCSRWFKHGRTNAKLIMSEEHKALGFRPPPGSLAADAQSAAAKHPDAAGVDAAKLKEAALMDAARIAEQRDLAIPVRSNSLDKKQTKVVQSIEQKVLSSDASLKDTLASNAQSANDSTTIE